MTHTRIDGLGVSPGIAIGKPMVQETRLQAAIRISLAIEMVDREVERFDRAVTATIARIKDNHHRAAAQMGEDFAAIFEAHELIAEDPALSEPVQRLIRTERVNAEWALDQIVGRLVARFERTGDVYFSERKLDVLDVATQIMAELHGRDQIDVDSIDQPVILVADDLPPSQIVKLPLDKILGLALESGGPTSHTTIIARSFGIPAIVGARSVCQLAKHSEMIALDAFEGRIVFNPDAAEISEYAQRRREYQEQQAHLYHTRAKPAVTRDGFRVELLANIDLIQEVDQALHWNVDGIGLYRSEFLYMKLSPALPSEGEHIALYRDLAAKLGDRPLTIRTFDLGGKKLAREVIGNQEANPVLGLRGIRLCFARPNFFRTQLRALVQVAAELPPGRLRIMLPLITGVEEVRIARLHLHRVIEELKADGLPVPAHPVPLGAMIEVPSSAIMARELAHEVDFLSIGTNDLIQYSLAVDRSNELVVDLYRPTHPAVLRLIQYVIAAGEAAGIEVLMCGEMAADPLMVPALVGLGLRKLSMSPQAVPVIRSLIRQLSFRESSNIARKALRMATAREIEEFFLERLALSLAKSKIRV